MGSIEPVKGQFNVKRIAVIGGGPSGLAAAKYLLAENCFESVDIFEQQSEVGGVWNYTPNIAGQTPVPQTTPYGEPELPLWPKDATGPLFSNAMYDRLKTNIPKSLMQYSDQDFHADSTLFPSREDVQEYLVKYSQDMRSNIFFSTQVENVSLTKKDGKQFWELSSRSVITKEQSVGKYDAVVVANGHYNVPFIPSVSGIEEFNSAYPSVITHSKVFRSPEVFTDKKVIVVGSAASGIDIGIQISKHCKKPMLNSVRESPVIQIGKENKEEVPPISEYLVDQRSVKFDDGRIEKDIDAIIYCTGYLYSYPFLRTMNPPIVTNGRRVQGLYQQIFNISYPTLAFVALPQKVNPLPLSESQGAVISKVWSNKLSLPEQEEMADLEKKQVEELGDGTAFHVLGYPKDVNYVNSLNDWVKSANDRDGKRPGEWTERLLWERELYVDFKKKFIEAGETAKTVEELGYKYMPGGKEPTWS